MLVGGSRSSRRIPACGVVGVPGLWAPLGFRGFRVHRTLGFLSLMALRMFGSSRRVGSGSGGVGPTWAKSLN